MDLQKLIDNYSESYCAMLEVAYGNGMMSEGGSDAIEYMLAGLDLNQAKVMDVGFGLAGVMFYLAKTYNVELTGLEINPWLVNEAKRRTPEEAKNKIDFLTYNPMQLLDFDSNSFDIIYSKGVLTHLENKRPLFAELQRILKPGGCFVLNDWISPVQGQWCKKIQTLSEQEELTLYAETHTNYEKLLRETRFENIEHEEQSVSYAQYNWDIVEHLRQKHIADNFTHRFSKEILNEFIDGYSLIASAMDEKELLVYLYRAYKPL